MIIDYWLLINFPHSPASFHIGQLKFEGIYPEFELNFAKVTFSCWKSLVTSLQLILVFWCKKTEQQIVLLEKGLKYV